VIRAVAARITVGQYAGHLHSAGRTPDEQRPSRVSTAGAAPLRQPNVQVAIGHVQNLGDREFHATSGAIVAQPGTGNLHETTTPSRRVLVVRSEHAGRVQSWQPNQGDILRWVHSVFGCRP
jgi:hypothetical protein